MSSLCVCVCLNKQRTSGSSYFLCLFAEVTSTFLYIPHYISVNICPDCKGLVLN